MIHMFQLPYASSYYLTLIILYHPYNLLHTNNYITQCPLFCWNLEVLPKTFLEGLHHMNWVSFSLDTRSKDIKTFRFHYY